MSDGPVAADVGPLVIAGGRGPATDAGFSPARLAAWICIPLLTLPVAIFAAMWLNPLIGIPVLVALAALGWRARRLFAVQFGDGRAELSRGELAAILIFSVVVVIMAGTGGYMPYQSTDWDKHNLVIEMLIRDPWPFTVTLEGRELTLAYHTAYHLLPALAGKAAGWPAANLVLAAQTSLGVAGALLLARAATGARILLLLTATLCFTGLDLVPNVVRWLAGYGNAGEWWADAFSYQNNINQLLYLPNQGIVAWIGAALLLNAHRDGRTLHAAAFIVPVSLLWASFVTIGLTMLAVPLWLLDARGGQIRPARFDALRSQLNAALPDLVLGMIIAAAVAAYLSLLFRLDAAVFDPASLALTYISGVTRYDGTLAFPAVYLSFLFVEFMTLALLLAYRREWRDMTLTLVLIVTAIILTVIPLIRAGFINDFALKASIAPLFMLQLLALTAWTRGNGGTRRMIFAYLLLAGASGAASLFQFARFDVARDLAGLDRFEIDLACQHSRYLQTIRLNYLAQYFGPYQDDALAKALLQRPRADRSASLEPSPECSASIRAAVAAS